MSSCDVLIQLYLDPYCRDNKMPNVNQDIKLDFKDVLLRPKRSKIRSRADVSQSKSGSNIVKVFNVFFGLDILNIEK